MTQHAIGGAAVRGLRPEVAPLIVAALVAVIVASAAALVHRGVIADATGAGTAVFLLCGMAAIAAHSAHRAANHSAGVERRVWRLFSYGLLSWALGVVRT